jgi:hypothetical protein
MKCMAFTARIDGEQVVVERDGEQVVAVGKGLTQRELDRVIDHVRVAFEAGVMHTLNDVRQEMKDTWVRTESRR